MTFWAGRLFGAGTRFENAGLLPWFTATALVHGAVMQEEKRGFHIWNVLLAVFSFALVLFGTFATRSGMIQSVTRTPVEPGHLLPVGHCHRAGGIVSACVEQARPIGSRRIRFAVPSRDGFFFLTLSCHVATAFLGLHRSVLPTITCRRHRGIAMKAGPGVSIADRTAVRLLVLLIGRLSIARTCDRSTVSSQGNEYG